MNFTDLKNEKVLSVTSLKYNEKYYYTGPDGKYVYYVDNNGDMHIEILVNKDILMYAYKNINVGGLMSCVFSEDGESFNLQGKTFTIGD